MYLAPFWLIIAAITATGATIGSEPLRETSGGAFEYETVAEVESAVFADPNVESSIENGWRIATNPSTLTIWSFAPHDYPASPAVVRRRAVPAGNGSVIEMHVLCEAEKTACDDLVRTFARMNGLPEPR